MSKRNNEILQKLDAFIRKYYKNQLLKGAILFLGLFLVLLLLVSGLEYLGRYTATVRTVLFFGSLGITLAGLVYYIIIPLSGLYRIRKTLSYEEAAYLIGSHFPEVSDKLLNTLQLMEQDAPEGTLLAAAIAQKSQELKPVPFTAAIKFKANLRYAKWVAIPLVLLVLILILSPDILGDGARRVLYYNKEFKPEAPFRLLFESKNLEAEQFGNFVLKLRAEGKQVPAEVYLLFEGQKYKMAGDAQRGFSYEWNNLQHSLDFNLDASGFEFGPFTLNVAAKPQLMNISVAVNYPDYLGMKDEVLNNPGDLKVPAGTQIQWDITAAQTEKLLLLSATGKETISATDNIHFSFKKRFLNAIQYRLKSIGSSGSLGDSLQFDVQVIPDAYPQLDVQEQQDSMSRKLIYFSGNAEDDHGLKKLRFFWRFLKSDQEEKVKRGLNGIDIPFQPGKLSNFNHTFNLFEAGVESGDQLEYYFEVWDNDGIQGSKSTRSKTFLLKAPDRKEIREESAAGAKALEEKMEESLKEARNLQKDLKDLQRKLQSDSKLNWEEQRKMEKLLERQKELSKKIEELKKDFDKNRRMEQEFKEENKKILEKQEQLRKMMDEVMSEEMKKMMKQLDEMMKMQNKDRIQQEMEKMELNNKDVEKELDRMLEMYKEMEVEKRMEESVKQLEDLSKKQQDLANQTRDKKQNTEQLKQKQDELNKEFKETKEGMKDMLEKNKELEEPKDLKGLEEKANEIQKKMDDAGKELDKGNEKKSAEKQEDAAEDMEEMAEQMKDKMEKEEEEKLEMNVQALRQILDNLLQLSNDQEDLMERFKTITGYNPQYVKMGQEQKILRENARLVEDSLLALSKNAPEIRAFVNREVSKMNDHMERAMKGFSTRSQPEIRGQQQYAMSRMNNLALMLGDVLKQMQDQQQQQKGKKGKGKPSPKKGQGKPSMSKLKQMQDELNKQLKEGQNKNGSGEKGKMSSEQFARMAAQQMAIRQQLQKMASEMDALEKEQMGGGKQLGDLQKLMEQTEKELFNKRLSQETIMRQQEILTRLLEHEKSEKKQEQEQKRESQQGKQGPKPSPAYFEQMNRKQQRETELLQTLPPGMQPYFRDKAREYLNKVN
ncbi:MAG: hypothetical protein LCH37_13310 [Bacteroidetes bacterium]|nr:hypothetical protein [Bacteroidota bacterium]